MEQRPVVIDPSTLQVNQLKQIQRECDKILFKIKDNKILIEKCKNCFVIDKVDKKYIQNF